jgi:hypothetical protein
MVAKYIINQEENMRNIDDMIQFEDRSEIHAILCALEEWQKVHTPDENVLRMIRMLDYMDMVW